MHPIYIMLAVFTAFTLLTLGLYIFKASKGNWRYLLLAAAGLPLSALINLGVKSPFVVFLSEITGYPGGFLIGVPVWMLVVLLLTAPVTEEAVKVVPLLVPPLRRLASDKYSGLLAGFALGVGFGIGEAAYLSYSVSMIPGAEAYPWYYHTNFAIERYLATIGHGAISAVFTAGIAQGLRQGVIGYLAAIALHTLLNTGAALYQLGLVDLLTVIIQLVVTIVLLVSLYIILRRRFKPEEDEIFESLQAPPA